MEHDVGFLATLTGALAAALVLGFATQRIGLSPIVGYLVAGVVVGPFTPGFVAHGELARQLANVGVILLMFGVGLNFHVKELIAVRRVALPGSLVCVAAATSLGFVIARTLGWSPASSVVYGLTISVSSTVVLLRVLSDRDALHTRAGHIAVGWLVVEDLFAVLALVLVPIAAGGARAGGTGAIALRGLAALGKIAGLVVLTFTVARPALRVLFGYVARTRSRDLFTLTVLVVALGVAVTSATLFGASMPLGAFLAGMVVGQSEFGSRAASEALPMRDAFAVVFFVSIGMLFDPRAFGPNAGLVAATLGVILVGKPLVAFGIARALRTPARTAATLAVALAQIGEFSFIMAAVGRETGLLPDRAVQALVAASIVSITADPLLMRVLDRVTRPRVPEREGEPETREPDTDSLQHRAVVVGYGPVGRTLTRLLREYSIEPTVIEMNHETVAELKRAGIAAVYGDATQREILERAGVAEAGSLIFAASGSPADAVVRMAKDLNPSIRILTRTTYVRDAARAREAGANVVIAAEAEVAMAMTEHLLAQLGASAEQLDRARERVRREVG